MVIISGVVSSEVPRLGLADLRMMIPRVLSPADKTNNACRKKTGRHSAVVALELFACLLVTELFSVFHEQWAPFFSVECAPGQERLSARYSAREETSTANQAVMRVNKCVGGRCRTKDGWQARDTHAPEDFSALPSPPFLPSLAAALKRLDRAISKQAGQRPRECVGSGINQG